MAVAALHFINIEIFGGIILKILIGILFYATAMWVLDTRIRHKVSMAFNKVIHIKKH